MSEANASSKKARPLVVMAFIFLAGVPAAAQDTLLRSVAWVEALSPAGVLLVQGAESGIEIAMLGGALLLFTAPNVALFFLEADGNAEGVRISRLISAGAGIVTSAAALGLGIAASLGVLDGWGLTPYAGSLMAISVPTLFAGLIDLIAYSVESELPPAP